ncbi:MAG TPA: hypothetical protein VIU12_16725 [Chryseolinea sp.]
MKALKGLLLFGILALVAGACFNPPELPDSPQITYDGDIYFRDGGGGGTKDSLVITINFKDGDGDLGLSSDYTDSPFNDVNLYLGNNGDTIPVGKKTLPYDLPQFLDVSTGAQGKLLTMRSTRSPEYSYLPKYTDADNCIYYMYDSVYVEDAYRNIFVGTDIHVKDTILLENPTAGRPPLPAYVLLDTFFYRTNPNYANIDVQFFYKVGNGSDLTQDYVEFDWTKEFCTISFNQRFPILASNAGPLEGKLTYAMVTTGIRSIFTTKQMRLLVKIRDRSLHTSNVVDTGDFTLDDIKRGG